VNNNVQPNNTKQNVKASVAKASEVDVSIEASQAESNVGFDF